MLTASGDQTISLWDTGRCSSSMLCSAHAHVLTGWKSGTAGSSTASRPRHTAALILYSFATGPPSGHADLLASFRGHSGSVKTVCPMPASNDVFASGEPWVRQGRGRAVVSVSRALWTWTGAR